MGGSSGGWTGRLSLRGHLGHCWPKASGLMAPELGTSWGDHLESEMLPGELSGALVNANITSKNEISKQLPSGLDTE